MFTVIQDGPSSSVSGGASRAALFRMVRSSPWTAVTAGEALEVGASVSGCTARMSIDFSYQYHNDIIAAVKQRAAGAQVKPSAAVQSLRGLEALLGRGGPSALVES